MGERSEHEEFVGLPVQVLSMRALHPADHASVKYECVLQSAMFQRSMLQHRCQYVLE
jgi:hypothetical protein